MANPKTSPFTPFLGLKGFPAAMWPWFFGGYAVFVAVLISYATHVALSRPDKQHRADAFRVLKLIWGTATGAGGIAAIAIRLHDFGLI